MSKNKQLDKEVTKAYEWCKKARAILKIKQSGPRFDKEGVDFKRFEAAMKASKKSLAALENHKDFEKFAKEFLDLSSYAQQAVDENNVTGAKSLTVGLELFNNKLLGAAGKLTPEQLKEADKGLQGEERTMYAEALVDAEKIKKELAALEATLEMSHDGTLAPVVHSFVGEVPSLMQTADSHLRADEVMDATTILGLVEAEAEKQHKRHELFLTFRRKYLAARAFEQELVTVDEIAAPNEPKRAGPVTAVMNEVYTAAKSGDYEAATTKLKDAETANAKARKGLKPEDLVKVKEFSETRAKFEKQYPEMVTTVGKALRMPSALDPSVKPHLEAAQLSVKEARRHVDQAKTVTELTTALDLLKNAKKEVDDATLASKKVVEANKKDDEAIKPWLKLVREAENALKSVELLTAAQAQYSQLLNLISQAKAKIKTDGVITIGYAAAVEHLKDYGTIVAKANQSQQQALTTDLPENLRAAALKAQQAVFGYTVEAPRFMAMIYHDELERLRNGIKATMVDAGPKELGQIVTKGSEDFEALEKKMIEAKAEMVKERKDFQTKLAEAVIKATKLREQGVPDGMLLGVDRTLELVETQEALDREWSKGKQKAENAIRKMDEISQHFTQYKVEWNTRLQSLEQMKVAARAARDWPPTSSLARSLLEDVLSVETKFNNTYDFASCLTECTKLKLDTRFQELTRKSADIPKDVGATKRTVDSSTNRITLALSEFDHKLWVLEAGLTGVVDPKSTELHKKKNDLNKQWFDYLDTNYYRSNAPVAAEAIQKKADEILNEIATVTEKLNQILGSDKLIAAFSKQTQQKEAVAQKGKLPEIVDALLKQVREETGTATTDERKRYEEIMSQQLSPEEREKQLQLVMDGLKSTLDFWRKKKIERFEKGESRRKELTDDLKKLKGKNLTFKGYHELMEKEAEDIKAMLETGDPDMLRVAYKAIGELRTKIDQFDPKKEQPGVVSFGQVETRIEEIGLLLGSESGTVMKNNIIKKAYPDTFERLNDQYMAAVKIATRSQPEIGMAALNPLEAPIREALERSKLKSDQCARYEERIRQAENLWDKIKKETGTRVTEKAGRVADYVAQRLEEAGAALGNENGLEEADVLITKVEAMLRGIRNATDPREKLFEEDGALKQEKELIIRMATQFDKELSAFKNKTLEATKKALADKRKRGEIRQTDLDDALKSVESLEGMAGAIGKLVKSYTANLETLPHKKMDAENAPDFEKAKADFERARGMLRNAVSTAERLAGATTTVNVNISEDFRKVQKNWTAQAIAFRQAMLAAVESVNSGVTEAVNSVGKTGGIDGNSVGPLNENSAKAIKLIEALSSHFRGEAFARPFETLADETKPTNETEEKQREKARLAAREEALLIMRQYRSDVLNDPVLTKLLDKKSPFAQPQVAAASGYLRAALKRIEIETLIGV